jgi:hypothetical protein
LFAILGKRGSRKSKRESGQIEKGSKADQKGIE